MPERAGYGDAEARRIIQRAAEIDAERGRPLDAPALREIAAEAGISPLAVDQALQELDSAPVAGVSWRKRHPVLVTVATLATLLLIYAVVRMVVVVPPG
jgi:DNA-binding transcriptional regulator YhcF (GntR family)